jgi:NAD-dependent SIR2 family protein deacetylase
MNNTVIILGAGASKSEGAPLQNDLFKSFFEPTERENPRNNIPNNGETLRANIKKFFSVFYGIEDIFIPEVFNKFQFPTFEEALGILEIAISKDEEYKNQSLNLLDFKNSIVYIMAQSIENKLDLCTRHEGWHKKLVSKVLDDNRTRNISFISTNYDLLIDNALLRNGSPNYGFKHYNTGIPLYKLHGSLNWLYCPTCKKIKVATANKIMISAILDSTEARCSYCGSNQKYVVIPPSYFKNYNNQYLSEIWNKAEEVLTEADHIIFCGYSFPDADIHIKYLLKRAELNRFNDNGLKISVFNHHTGKKRNIKIDEESRFKRFFKKTTNVNYFYNISFEKFIDNITSYLND